MASELAADRVSDSWVTRFLDRHRDQLLYKWANAIDAQRLHADSSEKYIQYFKLVHSKITEYSIEPRHTYNMDEKGFAIGVLNRRTKRVFSRASVESRTRRQPMQDGNRQWVSILASVCADGSALPPGIIYPGAPNEIQSSWVEDIDAEKHSVFVTATPSGWTNDEVGLAWLEQVFDRYTREKARRSWRLLIVDGHGSHITWSFIKYCDRNRILLLVFPPHSTHTLQPLDVALFSPLGTSYTNQLTEHLHSTQGLVGVKKRDFFRLFYESWTCTFTPSLILKAFEVTGLSPPNAAVIVDKFRNKRRQLPRTPSPIAADNWKQAIQILAQVVENQDAEEVQQLRRTISHLSAHTQLVQLENEGLRNVIRELKPSKNKRRRLDLQHHQEFP